MKVSNVIKRNNDLEIEICDYCKSSTNSNKCIYDSLGSFWYHKGPIIVYRLTEIRRTDAV